MGSIPSDKFIVARPPPNIGYADSRTCLEKVGRAQRITPKGTDGIVFRPTGDFDKSDDGTPILASVTKIEVVLVGNYHSND